MEDSILDFMIDRLVPEITDEFINILKKDEGRILEAVELKIYELSQVACVHFGKTIQVHQDYTSQKIVDRMKERFSEQLAKV